MASYVVLYRDIDSLPADPPLAFPCTADDADHAEKQCENAYPGCRIAWIYQGGNVPDAYDEYFGPEE